jgi:hypothetical protein
VLVEAKSDVGFSSQTCTFQNDFRTEFGDHVNWVREAQNRWKCCYGIGKSLEK